jgi:peroxiredoxin
MASRKQPKVLEAGAQAPDFLLDKLDGGSVSLADLAAQGPVLLAFFKISCPVCQLTFPFLERLAAGTLPVYGISQDDDEDTRRFAREFGVTFPLLLDREENDFPASNAFGIAHVPTLFLVERGGAVERVIEGWSRRDIAGLGERAGVDPLRPSDRVPELKAG